jgi:flap endonuclease-1
MGLNIAEIVPRKAVQFSELKGKTIAIDAFNTLYQFLSSIRQADGTPLMDSKKRVTSHLSGLFYRNVNLLSEGIKLVYVFDGIPPELKRATGERRREMKDIARGKYLEAKDREDVEDMGKYAKQLSILNDEMIEESKELLEAMGIGVIQAPSEGESQAAYLTREGAFAVGSQDYDSVLFGAKRLIQNLTLARTRKTASGIIYISPEMIELEHVLNSLGINLDQLICLGILVGTDYNPGGIKGIGQKKALEIVKKQQYPFQIFKSVEEQINKQALEGKGFDWSEIYELFHKPSIIEQEIEFPNLDEKKIKEILVNRHEFNEERVDNQLEKLRVMKEKKKQKTLF